MMLTRASLIVSAAATTTLFKPSVAFQLRAFPAAVLATDTTVDNYPRPASLRTSTLTALRMSSSSDNKNIADSIEAPVTVPGRPTWQQTMLRVKDPQKSLEFYKKLGFTHIDQFDFPDSKFSLYFMTTLKPDETYDLTPGTQAAHDYLWTMEGTAIELTHNHGSESDDSKSYHPGNKDGDGFGHIAVK